MFVFSKGRPKSVNLIRDHKNIYAGDVKIGHGRRRVDGITNNEGWHRRIYKDYAKRNNWWYIPNVNRNLGHPAAFPVELARDHILSWSAPGDTVLDPFMGSGTTGVACCETGRNFVGIEISEEYFRLASDRINAASAQVRVDDILTKGE